MSGGIARRILQLPFLQPIGLHAEKETAMALNTQMDRPNEIETPVLIVGGGPVGLALACELGWRGVKCLLVERRDGAVTLPKMNQVGVRTMEFCRRWGISGRVQAQSVPEDYPRTIMFVTSAGPLGHELGRYEFPSRSEELLTDSPEAIQRCSQLYFDPILSAYAKDLPSVSMRYKTSFEAMQQDEAGVTSTLADAATGRRLHVRSRFVVACDGGNSTVRESAGIGFHLDKPLSLHHNIFFHSNDLANLCPRGRAQMQWIISQTGVWAMLSSVDGKRLWRLSVRATTDSPIEPDQAKEYLARAVGRNLSYELLPKMMSWARRSGMAECFAKGRVFLCGDSAHQLSPTGGFGMNTGIQEAVDLGWKLAAVVDGWGGEHLLTSYDVERRPIAQRAVDEAEYNYRQFSKLPLGPEIDETSDAGYSLRGRITRTIMEERFDREYNMIGMALGYRYEDSPIIVPDGTAGPFDDPTRLLPTARPGHRAPHAWLSDGRSILDLFRQEGYTLMRFDARSVDVSDLVHAASSRGLPLAVVDVDDPHACDLYQRRLVLVRPDGHVAWRGDQIPDGAMSIIDTVRGAQTAHAMA